MEARRRTLEQRQLFFTTRCSCSPAHAAVTPQRAGVSVRFLLLDTPNCYFVGLISPQQSRYLSVSC